MKSLHKCTPRIRERRWLFQSVKYPTVKPEWMPPHPYAHAYPGPRHALKSASVFNLFGRKRDQGIRPPRGPGQTVRAQDLAYLKHWASQRRGVEGFVEPETLVNEMSVVLVDATGEWTRRKIGGPRGIDAVARGVGIPLYFAEETGYPQRMRERIERDRLLKARAEQMERRARIEAERARAENARTERDEL